MPSWLKLKHRNMLWCKIFKADFYVCYYHYDLSSSYWNLDAWKQWRSVCKTVPIWRTIMVTKEFELEVLRFNHSKLMTSFVRNKLSGVNDQWIFWTLSYCLHIWLEHLEAQGTADVCLVKLDIFNWVLFLKHF